MIMSADLPAAAASSADTMASPATEVSASGPSHSAVAASQPASPSVVPSPSSALAQRLQRTNQRIAQLLDQMSWKEEQQYGAVTSSAAAGAVTAAAPAASEPAQPASGAPAAAAPAAAASSLLSSCRPFDRAAFLARVSTFTPLAWLYRAEIGPALSPLHLARHGWIASGVRDTVICPLCDEKVLLHFAPELLALSHTNPAAVRLLARRYATEMIPQAHQSQCAWRLAQSDIDFTRIVPGGARPLAHGAMGAASPEIDASASECTVSASQRAVVLGQAEQRASSLRHRAPAPLWTSFTVAHACIDAINTLLRSQQGAFSTANSLERMDVCTLLSLCGWEMRTSATDASVVAAASSATSSLATATLQCCFGCREIGALERFCAPPESKEQQEETATIEAAHDVRKDDDGDADDRSVLQSPLKRRKLADATAAPVSFAECSSAPPAVVHTVRTSPVGFHALREHRPFCPFVQPLLLDEDARGVASAAVAPAVSDAAASQLSSRASASDSDERKDASSSQREAIRTEALQGWQHVWLWWGARELARAAEASRLQASEVEGAEASASTLPHKERQIRGAIDTVRRLLSNVAPQPTAVRKA